MTEKHRETPASHDVVYSIPLIEKHGKLCVVFGHQRKMAGRRNQMPS